MKVDLMLRGQITNAQYPTHLSMYQAAVGSHKVSDRGATNFIIERLWMIGETDNVFCRNTNLSQGSFISCVMTSKWDAIADMEAAHRFDFFDCDIRAIGTNVIHGAVNRSSVLATENWGQTHRFFNCLLISSNTGSYTFAGNAGPLGGYQSTNEFYGCAITNLSASTEIIIANGDDDVYRFFGSAYATTKVDENGYSSVSANAVNIATNYAFSIKQQAIFNNAARFRARQILGN
jgi:hypothetical protein